MYIYIYYSNKGKYICSTDGALTRWCPHVNKVCITHIAIFHCYEGALLSVSLPLIHRGRYRRVAINLPSDILKTAHSWLACLRLCTCCVDGSFYVVGLVEMIYETLESMVT